MGDADLRLQPGEPTWHLLPAEEIAQRLRINLGTGLSEVEARRRLEQYGANEIREGRRRGPIAMFLGQFTDFMILVLIAAAIISGLIGDVVDTLVIVAIVTLNAVIGFVQEYRAERAIAALKQMAALQAQVRRSGRAMLIPAADLVPGDVVVIEAGNAVPADLRLTEAVQLRIEEAALTGESQPVEKITRALHEPELPLGDRRNMAYKGTLITYGRGHGVVVATGMHTELGRIAMLLREEGEVKTPLQKRLTRFGRLLAIAVLVICAIMFVTGLLRGEPLVLMLLTAISLAVAAIPEALPAVVTVSLALGARKMVSKNALIRKLPAVETLGSVTFICSDKTGTLTENRMRAEEFCVADQPVRSIDPASASSEPWRTLWQALALSNDARVGADGAVIGDPTEVALFEAARAAGVDKTVQEAAHPRVSELPFESERARMTTLHREGEAVIGYTKGAPERVLPLCHDRVGAGGTEALDRGEMEIIAERMAADGLRVLAVALRRWPALPDPLEVENVETGLSLIGLVGLLDPPRGEAREAVGLCRSAGITPVMITGDHPATARAIAQRLNIIGEDAEVLTGRELARIDMEDFEQRVERVRVYARVAPEQKIKIVKALQDKGEFVAMTGDGVNDAPALRRADIGVAMGITGTDVAKEAGHMILLDDNFATIVSAVREGRRIFDNIRKFVRFVMTGNSGEIGTLFLAPFLGLPIPLLPIHILWVNLVTDGLPGLALAVEPEEKGIMQRPPRAPQENLFAHGIWQHILWVGGLITALCLFTQAWAIRVGDAHWQTMVFTVLTLSQMTHVLAIRSETESMFTRGFTTNMPLLGAVLLTFALQLATIYVPMLNPIFRTQPLTAVELSICLMLAATVFVAVEIEKWMVRRGWLYNGALRGRSASI
ncbi:MAG: cation-translocating P-type ATPase [Gammaproteobacteria bacterium]|nr:cation-translocating P-type ATPase [Gammaproteobacteria bacterium]MDH3406549.1 cation-translocating P-type ATPase [Gammaproteobacteria bacterium]MDH5487073.1 cation-translocating P-type ATPase [Gammaproteobacteria bacterium]